MHESTSEHCCQCFLLPFNMSVWGLCLTCAEDPQTGKQAGGFIHGAKESAKRYSIDIVMSVG